MTVTQHHSIFVSQSAVGPANPVTGALSPPSADGQPTPQQTEFARAFQRQTGTSGGNLSRRETAAQPSSRSSKSPLPSSENKPAHNKPNHVKHPAAKSTPSRPDHAEQLSHANQFDHAEKKRPGDDSEVDSNPVEPVDGTAANPLGVDGSQPAAPQPTQSVENHSDEAAVEGDDVATASANNATSTPPAGSQSTKPFLQIFVPSQSASDQDAAPAGDLNSDRDVDAPHDAPSGLVQQIGRGRRESNSKSVDADQVATDNDRVSLSFQAFRKDQLAKSQSKNGQNDAGSDAAATESQKKSITETDAAKPAVPVAKSAASNRREATDAATDPQASVDVSQTSLGGPVVSGVEKPDSSVKAESQLRPDSKGEADLPRKTDSQGKGTSGLKTDSTARGDSQAKTDSKAKPKDLAKEARTDQATEQASPPSQVSVQHVTEVQETQTPTPDGNTNPNSGLSQPEQVVSGNSLRGDIPVARDGKSKAVSQKRFDASHDDTTTVRSQPGTPQPQGFSTTAKSDPLAQVPSGSAAASLTPASHDATQRREVTGREVTATTPDGTVTGADPVGSPHRASAGSTAGSTASSAGGANAAPLDPRVDLDRLADTVRFAGASRQTMSVRLNPGHLGSMQIDVSVEQGVTTARLQVESLETHRIVTDGLDRLRESLSRAGAHVDRVEVTVVKSAMQHDAGGRFDGTPSDGQPHSNGEGFQDRGESTDQRQTPDQPRLPEVDERTVTNPKPAYRRANGLEQIDIQV